jgi:periplasmic divalent cation tolerance protein
MSYILVYITAKDIDEAEKLGQALVSKRLAACVNIIPGMRSMYWWDGAVQREDEVVVLAKTRAELAQALTAEVKALHSFDVPCIVTLAIDGGHPDFLNWIGMETRNPVMP